MKFTAKVLLIDCGKASKETRGLIWGAFIEAGQGPTHRWG